MPKLYIKTYGCQMNERDSEQVARMFVQKGYTMTDRGFWPSSSSTVRM